MILHHHGASAPPDLFEDLLFWFTIGSIPCTNNNRKTRKQHAAYKEISLRMNMKPKMKRLDVIGYYTGPVNSPESTEFMGPETMDIQPGD